MEEGKRGRVELLAELSHPLQTSQIDSNRLKSTLIQLKMDENGSDYLQTTAVKRQRATTSSKGRTSRSPSPYRSRPGQTPAELYASVHTTRLTAADSPPDRSANE
jgi:hypothetical protein